jgi:hypothetical protein
MKYLIENYLNLQKISYNNIEILESFFVKGMTIIIQAPDLKNFDISGLFPQWCLLEKTLNKTSENTFKYRFKFIKLENGN